MQIGEKNFLSGKEETRRNPDGFQAFLTQPDETFSVKIRAGAYWYSFSDSPFYGTDASSSPPSGRRNSVSSWGETSGSPAVKR